MAKTKRDSLQELADSLTSEQYIQLLDIAHPIPAEERAALDAMTDDELLAALTE